MPVNSKRKGGEQPYPFFGCQIRELPPELLYKAAETAAEINPANAPRGVHPPDRIAVLTSKYWGAGGVKLSVSFMEMTSAELQKKIVAYMNRWAERANVTFALTAGVGQVRISRGGGGYWSYLGTDVQHIPSNQQTMNLEQFTLSTPESEYERVITHETGHTLGFPHEHLRAALVALLDANKTIAYFMRTQGWSRQDVIAQVLQPLNENSLMATPADSDSIMCYQIPGECTKNGQPIRGGASIDESDFGFAARIYPKAVVPPPPPPPPPPPVGSGIVSVDVANRTVSVPAGWTVKQ
jgi:hypothetical protein